MLIKDNVLSDIGFIDFFNHYILYGCDHYKHFSISGSEKMFYSADLTNDFNTKYLTHLINNEFNFIKKYNIGRVYFNLQWPGQVGEWHLDDGDMTLLFFISEPTNDGFLNIRFKEKEEKIEYKKNRLVLFEGNKYLHKADCFKESPRISIAYKLLKNEHN
jgi:hypothetical protein